MSRFCRVLGLTICVFLTIINPIYKGNDVQRAKPMAALSEPGRVQARCAGGLAALQRASGDESDGSPALWVIRGRVYPFGRVNRSGTANQRLFVPGRQAFSFTQKTGIT